MLSVFRGGSRIFLKSVALKSKPVPGCPGTRLHNPRLARSLPSSRSLPSRGWPSAAAWPRRALAWEKSFQTALLGADWPRRTRSRGAAANGRRPPRARGRWRWLEAGAAQSAAAAAARPREPSPGKFGAAGAGGGGRPGTAATAGKLFRLPWRPPRPRDSQEPPCREPAAPLAFPSLPGCPRSALPGRWAQKSRSLEPPLLTLCLPTFVSSRPPLVFASFLSLLALASLRPALLLVPSPRCPAPLPSNPPLTPTGGCPLTPLVSLLAVFGLFSVPATSFLPAAPSSPLLLVPPPPPSRPLPLATSTLSAGLFPKTSPLLGISLSSGTCLEQPPSLCFSQISAAGRFRFPLTALRGRIG